LVVSEPQATPKAAISPRNQGRQCLETRWFMGKPQMESK